MSNKRKYQSSSKKISQIGKGSSDFIGSFYAPYASAQELSRYTLQYIDQAPMFNPLQTGAKFPTGTSGVIPTGSYLDAIAPLSTSQTLGPPVAQYGQYGGTGKKRINVKASDKQKKTTNPWISHVKQFAMENNLTYSQALKHPNVKDNYTKKTK